MNTKSLLEILPTNIVESEELSIASKKMLGALIDYYSHSQAKETQRLFMSNDKICETANFGKSTLFNATRELEMYDLIEKKSGKARTQGQKSEASEYILHIDNFIKPLRKKTFENLMSMFPKSWLKNSGNPLQDCSTVQNSTVQNSIEQSREDKNSIEQSREEKLSVDKSSEDELRIDEISLEKNIEDELIIDEKSVENKSLDMSIEDNERKDESKIEKRIEQKVENEMKTDNEIENTLFQFFVETVNLNVEELYNTFTTHFNYDIESNKELAKKVIDYVFDKLAHTDYELYRKVCENIETVFNLEKPQKANVKKDVEEDMVRIGKYVVIPRERYEMLEEPEDALPF